MVLSKTIVPSYYYCHQKSFKLPCKLLGNLLSEQFFFIAMRISGKCSISSTGIITGKIRSHTDVIRRSTGCIFLSSDKQVAPVQKNGDQNQFDNKTKIVTFTRTTTTRANDMGRAEMNFCFTKPRSSLFTGFNSYQKQYLKDTKQVDEFCPNAVHKTSVATQGTYRLEVYIPKDSGTATAKSTVAQWHGRPRRLVFSRFCTRTDQPFTVY